MGCARVWAFLSCKGNARSRIELLNPSGICLLLQAGKKKWEPIGQDPELQPGRRGRNACG
jgi:hypothetical protein